MASHRSCEAAANPANDAQFCYPVSDPFHQWVSLVEETQRALTFVRPDELEELAGRAACLLAATLGPDAIRQRIPRPSASEMAELRLRQAALGDLLHATGENLGVLRHSKRRLTDSFRVREANCRWEL